MYIGIEEGWKDFQLALKDVAAGELLLYKEKDTIYFDTNNIYCNYAGYAVDWKNFIGYQNVIFFKEIKKVGNIARYDNIKCLDYESEELKTFLDRSRTFGINYVYFEDFKVAEQINKVIELARPLNEEISKAITEQQVISIFKEALNSNLPSFYSELLLLKSMLNSRYADKKIINNSNNKIILSSENILAVWRANAVV